MDLLLHIPPLRALHNAVAGRVDAVTQAKRAQFMSEWEWGCGGGVGGGVVRAFEDAGVEDAGVGARRNRRHLSSASPGSRGRCNVGKHAARRRQVCVCQGRTCFNRSQIIRHHHHRRRRADSQPVEGFLGPRGVMRFLTTKRGARLCSYNWPAENAKAVVMICHGHGAYLCFDFLNLRVRFFASGGVRARPITRAGGGRGGRKLGHQAR